MNKPLVSVICLCYNHSRFVKETLESVFRQTYSHVEVIVVDDASTDGSKELIEKYLFGKNVPFIALDKNQGNTTAFNWGLAHAKGRYVIDLACDDVLEPDRIKHQVDFFESCDEKVGVIYGDAEYISERGASLGRHFSNPKRKPNEGEVYQQVISTYFIPPPTMMMRRDVLIELGGYDERLAYEDFDFWVRSARTWHYAYQNEVLTKIRVVTGSHSRTLYQANDRKLASTIVVCEKIEKLNKTEEEQFALVQRLRYEIRHAFLTGHKNETASLLQMLKRNSGMNIIYQMLSIFNWGLNLSFLRNLLVGRSI